MRMLIPVLLALMVFSGCIQLPGAPGKAPGGSSAPASSGQNASSQGTAAGTPASQGNQSAGTSQNQTPPAQSGTSNQTPGQTSVAQQTNLKSSEISYLSGAWKVYGTLYDSTGKAPTKAILLLPGLGQTRDSYPASFIETLHTQFPDAIVVALDMRGHGKSTNLGTYQSFDSAGYKDMKTDVLSLIGTVEHSYPDVETYYVVGSSMGSTAGLLAAAQDDKITKVVMISPGMDYEGVDITHPLGTYVHDLLVVSASGDTISGQSPSQIASIHGSTHTTLKTYSGSEHGTDLFAATDDEIPSLSTAIVDFLKQ